MPMRTTMLLLAFASAACATHAESVCQDIGYCTTQSSDQVHSCELQVKQLALEASAAGCSSQYDAYFACADDRYDCKGNVPTFEGCESARAALDSCLAAGRANNACGELAARLAQCSGESSPDPSAPPGPCGAAEVCSSRCYLNSMPNVCLPQPTQLAQALQCVQSCPL
jgi:hypothetical protein